ncbi:MAG: anti-sigma factor [Chloroflexi bacterium]|nr:anti-sigma factor [Chloroflexota bacterium]MBL7061286.1 anti-sigma factor [Dehalococcoidia bacterium]
MKKGKYTEKQFIEYLDKLLAGEEISLGDDVSDEVRSALELAKKMLAYRDEPSPDFRASLRDRLLRKLAEEEAAATSPARGEERRDWTAKLFPQSLVWRAATSAALVVLLVVIGAVWYTGRYGQMSAPASAPPPPPASVSPPPLLEGDYPVSLPSNIVPEHMTFTAKTALSAKPGQAPVYEIQSAGVTTESVTALGRRLGFSGEARFIDGGAKIAMFDGEGEDMRELTVWTASGAIEYGFVEPDKLYPPYTPDLPSQEEAEHIAYDFLEQADLLPPGYEDFAKVEGETKAIAGGSYSVGEKYTEETAQQAPAYWLISFPYPVDDTWTTGPGSKIEVSIGDGGEVAGLLWAWRQMTPVYTESIISQKQAYQHLIQGEGSLDVPLDCEQVVVEDVQLKYWINPPSEKQDYAVPVYEFKGQCLDKSGRHLEDFTAWTEALSSTY